MSGSIVDKLRSGSVAERKEALQRAPEIEDAAEDADLLGAVSARLWDDDADTRRAALEAVGRLTVFRGARFDGNTIQRVQHLTNDESPRVRAESAVALTLLARTHREEHLRLLRRMLADPAPLVRQDAAAGLGDLEDHDSIPLLIQHLDDDDVQVRFEAAFALAGLKRAEGASILEGALLTGRRRLDACEALRRLGDVRALPPLQKLASKMFLSWPDRLTVWATAYALGDHAAATQIRGRTASRNREERAYALALVGSHTIVELADELARVAESPKDPLRDTAVRALGALKDPRFLHVLVSVAEDSNSPEELRKDAVLAVADLDGAQARRALEGWTKGGDPALASWATKALRRTSETETR